MIPGVRGKFGLGEQNEAGQMFTEFCHENALECLVNNTREKFTHGYHQIINTEIKLVIFFVAKDGESLYSQQKQDYGSDHELLIANFRLELKKVGENH